MVPAARADKPPLQRGADRQSAAFCQLTAGFKEGLTHGFEDGPRQLPFRRSQHGCAQKLHLLLIEAALRLANRARDYWEQGRDDRAMEALDHAQAVLAEMRSAIRYEIAGEVAQRVSEIYEFIFRSLVNAAHRHDEKSLGDAIRILEIERGTWQKLCVKLSTQDAIIDFDDSQRQVRPPQFGEPDPLSLSGGFSIEA